MKRFSGRWRRWGTECWARVSSEGAVIVATPELPVFTAIVADDANHFVKVGSHLDAAGQADEARVAFVPARQSPFLSLRHFV